MAEPTDRWSAYTDVVPTVASGWRFDVVTQPSRLGGSNGMTIGPDGRLYVTQVFFSQITAIDVETGEHAVFSPLGSGISGPDDAIFGADGTCFATEPMYGRVTARQPDGAYRVVAADLPAANGCTMDHARQRLFIDEFRPGRAAARGRPERRRTAAASCSRTSTGRTPRRWVPTASCTSRRCSPTRSGPTTWRPVTPASPSTTSPGRRR